MKLKQNDMIVLAVALFAGILFAVIADKYVFSKSAQGTNVDVVPAIHTDFPSPPSQYFNSQAVDPTQNINIGPNNSQQIFSSTSSTQ